jgi:Uma2 family endonuclease
MALVTSIPQPYSVEAYFALEREAETRSEYRDGEIIQMTGGTPTHNEIIGNLIFLLKAALRGQPYSIFVTDQRLWIPDRNLYTYPDVMVLARPIALQAGRKDTVTHPVFIAEVLSDSTEAYDRGDKFAAYRTIPSFQEYVLIDQTRPRIEHYLKQNANQWLFTEYSGKEAKVLLSSLSVDIALSDLYETIEFAE